MIITTIHYNRPEYTAQCLEYLEKCINISKYEVLAFVEPINDEVIKLLENCPIITQLNINKEKIGVNRNTLQALYNGFELDNFVLHVEDDVLLSKLSLLAMENNGKYYENYQIFNIASYSRTLADIKKEDVDQQYITMWDRRQNFSPWGFATWRDRFKETILNNLWCDNPIHYQSWDIRIRDYMAAHNLFEIYPIVSYSQNIGANDGVHVSSPQWHRENQYTPIWQELFE